MNSGICTSIGALPTSYVVSLSYEEQLIYLTSKMNEIINFMNDNITEELQQYIDQRFNDIMVDTSYDSQTETLILYVNRGEE